MGTFLGYMVVPFLGGCDTLRGVSQGIENEGSIFQHTCNSLEGTLTDLIKNQSIDVD